MISDGGMWMFPALIVGVMAVLVAGFNLIKRSSSLAGAAKNFALATFFLGFAGTAMGLYAFGQTSGSEATSAIALTGFGVSFAPLFAGSALAGLSALILGFGSLLSSTKAS